MIKFSMLILTVFVVGYSCKHKVSENEKQLKQLELIKKRLLGEDTAYNRMLIEKTAKQLAPTKQLRSPDMIARENKFIDSLAKTGLYTDAKFYHSPIQQDSNGKYVSEYFCSLSVPLDLRDSKDSLSKESKKIAPVIYRDVLKGDTAIVGIMPDTVKIINVVTMYVNHYDWYDRQTFWYSIRNKIFKRK